MDERQYLYIKPTAVTASFSHKKMYKLNWKTVRIEAGDTKTLV